MEENNRSRILSFKFEKEAEDGLLENINHPTIKNCLERIPIGFLRPSLLILWNKLQKEKESLGIPKDTFPLPMAHYLFGKDGKKPLQSTSSGRSYRYDECLHATERVLVVKALENCKSVVIRIILNYPSEEEIKALLLLSNRKAIIHRYDSFRVDMAEDYCMVLIFPFKKYHEPSSYPQLWDYLEQLFQALHHCQSKNVVHNDIKSTNIRYDKKLFLIDFGEACMVPNRGYATERGTYDYFSPEVWKDHLISCKRDMWATAILIILMVYDTNLFPITNEDDEILMEDQIVEIMQSFVASAAKTGKPWPDLCHTHPKAFDCSASEENANYCSALQNLLKILLVIDPKERATAQDALQQIQEFRVNLKKQTLRPRAKRFKYHQ